MASLLLGLSSLIFLALTGIPAVICGRLSLSQIKRSEGKQTGRTLALVGIACGSLGVAATIAVAVFVISLMMEVNQGGRGRISLNQAKSIAHECFLYAADHGGRFPMDLDELVPDYAPDRPSLADPKDPQKSEIGYFYYGGGHTTHDSGLLLASKAQYGKRRAIVMLSGAASLQSITLPRQ